METRMIKEEMMLRFLSLSLACSASIIFFFSWLLLLPSICVYRHYAFLFEICRYALRCDDFHSFDDGMTCFAL